jgi:hypothetical protein
VHGSVFAGRCGKLGNSNSRSSKAWRQGQIYAGAMDGYGARAAGGAVAGAAGPQQAGVRWLVLAGAVTLVLAVLVAAWWRVGDRYSSLSPSAEYLIRPFPLSPAAERAAGRGSVLAAIVAATWLTWASLRHDFDLRWWSVLGPLVPAGIVAGFIWRVFTTRVGGPLGTGCVILSACPVLAALLGWAVTRSLTLLE